MVTTDRSSDSREERVRAGDRAALAALLGEGEGTLRRWVERRIDRRMQARVSASDVVQDVFLAAAQRLDHFRALPGMPFGVWVRLLAAQRLVEIHRRHLGAAAHAADREVGMGANSEGTNLAEQLPGDLTSPSRVAVRHETLESLAQAIDMMDAIDREVIVLRHFDELSNAEVAARLGLSKDAASKRYIRALGRLKTILEEVPGLLED